MPRFNRHVKNADKTLSCDECDAAQSCSYIPTDQHVQDIGNTNQVDSKG